MQFSLAGTNSVTYPFSAGMPSHMALGDIFSHDEHSRLLHATDHRPRSDLYCSQADRMGGTFPWLGFRRLVCVCICHLL